MRQITDLDRLKRFMKELGRAANEEIQVFFTGGATAVMLGWRATTIDIDLKMVPESDILLRAISLLKNDLEINVELASPDNFIPPLPGWRDRSPSIGREGKVTFFHYDPYSQALA